MSEPGLVTDPELGVPGEAEPMPEGDEEVEVEDLEDDDEVDDDDPEEIDPEVSDGEEEVSG